jgi:hypothetical protein
MAKKWACPVCGTAIRVPIYRHSSSRSSPQDERVVIGYRCKRDHIYLADRQPSEGQAISKPAIKGRRTDNH